MGKKKLFVCVFVLSVLLGLLGVFNKAAISADKPIKLSFANFFPPSHFTNTEQFPQWIKEIEEATGGRVKITNYPGQALLEAPEIYEGVVSGTADMGHGSAGYSPGRFPVTEAFELQGIYFGSATANSMVMYDGFKEFKLAEYDDVKVMYLMAVGPGFLYSRKPVRRLEDLKGMRIRAAGQMGECVRALGGTPIAMTMPEVYEALSKGVLDGQIAPPEVLNAWRQAEVTKYIVKVPPIYASIQFSIMNLGKWNSLSKDIQQAIDKVNDGWYLKAGQIWDSKMKEAIDYGVKEHGMEVIRLSQEEEERWLARLEFMKDQFIEEANAKGLPGKKILDFVIQKAAIYSQKYPSPLAGY